METELELPNRREADEQLSAAKRYAAHHIKFLSTEAVIGKLLLEFPGMDLISAKALILLTNPKSNR